MKSNQIVTIVGIVVLVVVAYAVFGRAGETVQEIDTVDESYSVLLSQVRACHALSDSDPKKDACYVSICENVAPVAVVDASNSYQPHSYECGKSIIDEAVSGSGPEFANAVLRDLIGLESGKSEGYWMRPDAYGLAQRIGHMLAQQSIATGEMLFMDCGVVDFSTGCSLGFFDEVVSEIGGTPSRVAVSICDSVPVSAREMCYYRIGHVFLKHHDRNVTLSLDACDVLFDEGVSEDLVRHCWDGVFAENVEFARPTDSTKETDILAPCSQIDEKYRSVCYSNHGPYILQFFRHSDFTDPLEVCSNADGYVAICEQSVQDALSD